MRTRFLVPCVALAMLVGSAGASAQSNDTKLPQSIAALKVKAGRGDAAAQFHLGFLYDTGSSGISQDHAQAAFWYRKAAEQGFAIAQNQLGLLYDSGKGVAQDYAQAAVWYRKAAEQGLAEAQFFLGDAYDKGEGVPQDYAQAAVWYRKAAEQGFPEAQSKLGLLYSVGSGVPQDFAEAYFWLDIGAANELPTGAGEPAKNARNMIASHLSSADLARTQERARRWFEDHPAKQQ
jgi:TPR repeat protein